MISGDVKKLIGTKFVYDYKLYWPKREEGEGCSIELINPSSPHNTGLHCHVLSSFVGDTGLLTAVFSFELETEKNIVMK